MEKKELHLEKLNILVTREQRAWLSETAREKKLSVSEVLRDILQHAMGKKGKLPRVARIRRDL